MSDDTEQKKRGITKRPRRAIKPWPFPGHNREERAWHVARTYRNLVFEISQGRCTDPAGELYRLDNKWAEHGIHQLTTNDADLLGDPDEWMTAPDLAHAISRPRQDIYNWARLGHIEQRTGPDGTPEYKVGPVLEYQQKLRERRVRRDNNGVN